MQNSDVGPLHALVARFANGTQPKVAAPCKTAFNRPSVAVNNRMKLDKAEGWTVAAQPHTGLNLYLGHLKKRVNKKKPVS